MKMTLFVAPDKAGCCPSHCLRCAFACCDYCPGSQKACDLVCGIAGIKVFIKALTHADLDPIYFCEAQLFSDYGFTSAVARAKSSACDWVCVGERS